MKPAKDPFKPTALSRRIKRNPSSFIRTQPPSPEAGRTFHKLFDLPREIRDLILQYAVTDPLGGAFTFYGHYRRGTRELFCEGICCLLWSHLHSLGQIRRRNALAAFQNLRATCRQLRDEVDDIFFSQNRFDVMVTRKAPVDSSPRIRSYIGNLQNLTIDTWLTMARSDYERSFLAISLTFKQGRWDVRCFARPPWMIVERGVNSTRAFDHQRTIRKGTEVEIETYLRKLELGDNLSWADVERIRRIVVIAGEMFTTDRRMDWEQLGKELEGRDWSV